MKCSCHDIEIERDEGAWRKEDGTILCEDGRRDEMRDDPFDRFDHGEPITPYTMLIQRRRERHAQDDAEFDAARARVTTPNHERTTA
jgi:hypothetical protein